MKPSLAASGAAAMLLVAGLVGASTFTVVNTDDSGPGTLRQAILDANANPGLDDIAFDIPGSGVHTITPAASLPGVDGPAVIDGYTQPGATANTDPIATNAVLLIELDGSVAGGTGLQNLPSGVGDVEIRGLVINRWDVGVHDSLAGSRIALVRGCFIGTDPAGTAARANATGVLLEGLGATIGGTSPPDRNLISGNFLLAETAGILVQSMTATIEGNLIGTDATGTLSVPNGVGVRLEFGSVGGVRIGGPEAGAGNVISGNLAFGLYLTFSDMHSVIQGNRIGTTADGTGPLPNVKGVVYDFDAGQSALGGTGPGEANVIAYNFDRGVVIVDGMSTGIAIRGNSIHDNFRLGIDLRDDAAPQANDPLDADTGVNGLQNFPIIRSVDSGGVDTHIVGKLHSAPSTPFQIDLYGNPACSNHPREFLEGETYLGTTPVTTDAEGNATFDVTLPVATESGARISATATDPDGNTSEFSQRILFSVSPRSGPEAGGTAFTAFGTDFADPTSLTIGGVPASGVTFTDTRTLTATAPGFLPGTAHDIVAMTPDGTTGTLVAGWVSDFLDVPEAQQFHDQVTTLVSNGITAGVGAGLYGVDQATLRQQMAVFLLKAKHGLCYAPPPCTSAFDDVACPSTFADWIEALAAEGITAGCGEGVYCPLAPVRRDQMAVFLLKAEHGSNYLPPQCTGVYDDVPCPSTFADWIEQLAVESITFGCGGGNYCPSAPTTRGQMAVFLTKTFSLQ